MIQVMFLAQLREQLACANLQVDAAHVATIDELRRYLCELHPAWVPFLDDKKILIALNHEYARGNAALQAGDEVAFFPPVTGG